MWERMLAIRYSEQNCGCQGGWGWGRDGLGVGISRCKLLYTVWINHKVLLYNTGHYIQYCVLSHNREEYIYTHTHSFSYYIVLLYIHTLCYTAETITTLQINYTSIKEILKYFKKNVSDNGWCRWLELFVVIDANRHLKHDESLWALGWDTWAVFKCSLFLRMVLCSV